MPDASRPRIHFTAREGWINDPLGLTWHDGSYHLFFQYVPGSTVWAPECRWGHATSPDLATWTEQPVALEPGDGDDGVWSGSLVQHDGTATVFYTSVQREDLDDGRVRVARPLDAGWQAWEKGPVVAGPPAEPRSKVFRDPFVFRDGDRWRMLIGGALDDDLAAALSYSSGDLASWAFDGIAAERSGRLRDPVWSGVGWECPQLIEVDGHHVLVVSVWHPDAIHHVAVAVGTWRDGRFEADSWQRLTEGFGYYAPSVFRDREGRPSIVFWIRGIGGAAEGWAGATSVPHLLAVEDGRVVTRPHPEAVAAATTVVPSGDRITTDGPTLATVPLSAATDVVITEEGFADLRLTAAGDDLVIAVGGTELQRLPREREEVRVLTDGPVVELWLGSRVWSGAR